MRIVGQLDKRDKMKEQTKFPRNALETAFRRDETRGGAGHNRVAVCFEASMLHNHIMNDSHCHERNGQKSGCAKNESVSADRM